MKSSLIGLAICILAVYFGDKLSEMRTIRLLENEMNNLKTLCSQRTTAPAFPGSVIKITEITIARVKTKQYTLKYFFEVGGNTYNTSVTTTKEPTGESIQVFYDKNNPAINRHGDPCVEIDRLANQKEYPGYYSTIGYILLFGGILFGLAFLKGFFRSLFAKKK